MSKLKSILFSEYGSKRLGLFRICFSAALFLQSVYFFASDFIQNNFIDREIEFPFFDFLLEPSPGVLKMIGVLMIVSSLIMITGRFFKLANFIYLLSFTSLWLMEKGVYNNHYYFISLICFLLIFTQVDKVLVLGKKSKESVFGYNYVVIILQLLIVFVVAGINKLTHHWLIDLEPLSSIFKLKVSAGGPELLTNEVLVRVMVWIVVLFQFLIIPFMLIKKTRVIGVVVYVMFNVFNFWLFYNIGDIGFFPLILVAFIPLFFSLEKNNGKTQIKNSFIQKASFTVLSVYFLLQVLIPFRHVLYSNHVDWSGEGQRFSWRMKIMYKEMDYKFYVKAKNNDKKLSVKVRNLLTDEQFNALMYSPDLIPNLADYLKKAVSKKGVKNAEVYCDFNVSMNGEEKKSLIKPGVDLAKINKLKLKRSDWINDFHHKE